MKKTLMVLTFALCATFVFAQTATPRMKGEYKKAATAVAQEQHNYGSSIFTKDDPVIFFCDFSATSTNYSTGTIVGGLEGHGQNYDYAHWRRWANVDSATFVLAANTYPRLFQSYFGGWDVFYPNMVAYLDTATSSAENGWMMMSVFDQSASNSGNFNAYILFDSIDASSASVIDFNFYQYYRKYYENCYVDYNPNGSGNNSTWQSMEINIRGIDVAVNGSLWGMYTYTLPTAAAGSPNLGIRLRYKSLNSNRQAYGYYWLVDDVTLYAGGANRMKKFAPEEYVEGNYHQIPQGLTINPAWYTQIQNIGYMAQNNINAKIYHLNATQDVATEIDAYNNGILNIDASKEIIVDRHGWIYADSMDYRGWYGYGQFGHGSGVDLPTETVGDNYIYAAISSDSVTLYYDTFLYRVNSAFEANKYRWGHDNGVLVYMPDNHWLYGFVLEQDGNWYVTEDPDDVKYWKAGYMVSTRYTTDAQVPTDWVIHGVELVASPVTNFYSTGSKISAVLSRDSFPNESEVSFPSILTGANVKTITSSDVNDSTIIGRNSAGWLDLGNYNSIYIPFPEQPALEPNTSYRIGYSMEEDGYFALAHEALGRYRVASPTRPDRYDTIIYFRNDESTAKFANVFPFNFYQNFIDDPSYGGPNRSSTFVAYNETNPMIRMIVGPRQEVLRHEISITCDSTDYGIAAYAGQEACGVTITPADGSTATITGSTDAYCTATVIVDGVEVQPWNEDTEEGDQNLKVYIDSAAHTRAYQYSFVNVTENHAIRFIFHEPSEPISIDPVAAGVRMNLQPNPATSVVNLNIEGVNGMVNCMLIDMSGRVVYNQNINAEAAQVIDLSNLAKGAYFVRITNDKFSKVEKLIVR